MADDIEKYLKKGTKIFKKLKTTRKNK